MKNKIILSLIASLIISNVAFADYSFNEQTDFTGEAFFSMPGADPQTPSSKDESSSHTIPPIKQLRMKLKNNAKKQNKR